jgi:hypothetical protein
MSTRMGMVDESTVSFLLSVMSGFRREVMKR